MFLQVDGRNVDFQHLVKLDYPNLDPISKGTWTFGSFGLARKEIKEASGGVINYNIEMNGAFGVSFGVVTGETIYTWNGMRNEFYPPPKGEEQ